MFDSPGLAPFCQAPFMGLVAGVLVYGLVVGPVSLIWAIRKDSPPPDAVKGLGMFLAIIAAPLACAVFFGLSAAMALPGPLFQPSSSDMAGAYQLDQSAGDGVTFPAHEIVFNADGTFSVAHMPENPAVMPRNTIDGSGAWHIEKDPGVNDGEWSMIAEFRRVNGQTDSRSMRFHITGHELPYELGYVNEAGDGFRFIRK